MSDKRFYNRPLGAYKSDAPLAEMADTINSQQIVQSNEVDADYFRALEAGGTFLNEAQVKAVRHSDGPLLTLAGAGSGKTTVLVCRTGYLIQHRHVPPSQILLVTFSTKAAREMKERIAALPGLSGQMAAGIEARTFHSFFLKILRQAGFNQDILSNERFKQILIKQILKDLNLGDSYQPETILALFSFYKMNMEELPERSPSEKEIKKVYGRYEEWKEQNQKFDFDDILVASYRYLKQSPSSLKSLQNRYRYIMVDEFQDTNLLQYKLINMIASAHENLCVVGDDDQTIYSFNGARNEFILNFTRVFPSAETVTLDINYRSTDTIVGLGNAVIKNNKQRLAKTLRVTKRNETHPRFARPATSDEEAEWVVGDIKEKVARGTHSYHDFVILHRTGAGGRAIFEQLSLEEIPFVSYSTGEQMFYEHWTVKPVIDHLRLALNPRYFPAAEGVLASLFVNREKGMSLIHSKEAIQAKKYPLVHLLGLPGLRDYQGKQIKERIGLIKGLKKLTPIQAIKHIREHFYNKFLEADDRKQATEHKESIKEMLDELEASAKRFDTILAFITFVDDMIEKHKEMKECKGGKAAERVSLMTIHRAKGLEFRTVYVIGASENNFPHVTAIDADKMNDRVADTNALEEERRLLYVAITRAKEELYISSPSSFRGKKADVSRFLLEVFCKETVPVETTRSALIKSQRTVLAWICESRTCNGWQRIINYEETQLAEKECPLCHGMMKQGSKAV